MFASKLPQVGTTIFTRMSALAQTHQALNLSQGFPDFAAPTALCDALGDAARAGYNQYPPMAGLPLLRQCVAEQLRHYRGVNVDAEQEVTIVPGATEGIFCAIQAAIKPGDEVIVLDPVYDSYEPAIILAGGVAVHVALQAETFLPDWSSIADALTARTRMIMINTPHNPCGSVWSAEDMATLEALAERHDLLVCSDEVYEFLVFDKRTHHSVLQWPALRARSFVHFSFGKTFSVTGWKTGYCIAPAALTRELRKVHQYVAFVAVAPVQHALANFMMGNPEYPGTLAAFYQRKRDLFCDALANSKFRFTPTSGSFFQLLDYSALSDKSDADLCVDWTVNHGIASIPISVFYERPPANHQLRFCFAKSDDTLIQAAERLCAI